jgi:hypothetical protein
MFFIVVGSGGTIDPKSHKHKQKKKMPLEIFTWKVLLLKKNECPELVA